MEKTLSHTPLTYEDTGKGPVVVLLHGFAEDSTLWKHQVALLAPHYRVIAPDWPGSGLSPLGPGEPPGAGEPSMESFAGLLHTLLVHERIDRAVVIGHSMGGYVALAFAEAYPDFVAGLGLFHSTAFADTPEKIQTRKRGQAFIRENGAALFIKQSTPNLFADAFKATHAGEVTALLQRGDHFQPEALIGYYEAMLQRPDRTHVLTGSTVPVLLIAGAQDNAVPLADSLRQAALAPTTFFHILAGTAHMGMWEAREASGRILLEYLAYVYKQ
ncbi:alpha/beta fold hydrolase [Dinghuibacter silviterrae]|uniref:Pimeloyl-ACP methyl ester carboxylesterase n=1 Tax=Dinghuibacter silviterrae TaxID=1539049 RepID=A0A4R8DEN8_9BACT|nr:alpha/beta fold hydrolase [Dinghuibacter silviterrae]TDW95708.1 pimeloyl-ACP methyl ester carboxylesterase [Dinghuibacter silviterrae]